ncbi:MAG: dTDP-4-dehydrorhamnose 3,5-epimerase [Patescibacteria group bacterium]
MQLTRLAIPDVIKITPRVFDDERGFFYERFTTKKFKDFGIEVSFVQDNISYSKKNVLRGLHYQLPPHGQGKFVYVTRGRVLDVAVDIRKSSPTFGQFVSEELSDENHTALFIPEGFAHGFITLSDEAIFQYKTTNFYAPEADRGVLFSDPDIGVPWGVAEPLVSEKDGVLPLLQDIPNSELYE